MIDLVTEDDICEWVYENNGVLYTRKFNNIHSRNLKDLPEFSLVCLTGYPNIINIFFNTIIKKFTKRFILITLETDVCPFAIENLEHPLVYHWFSWNKRVLHPKLTCIPIGLNKDRHSRSMNTFFNNNYVDEETNNVKYVEKTDLFAVNLSVSSNPERIKLIETAKNKWNKFCKYIDNIPFKETYMRHSHIEGHIRVNVTDSKCYDILSKFKFVLSPPGAGFDCHRTWEALYCNTIPIIIESNINELYNDLPVVIVSSWDEINEQFLNNKYNEIQNKFANNKFNMKKLRMSYWIELINNKRKEGLETILNTNNKLLSKPKIHFMSYGNENFINSRQRIMNEAHYFDEFSSIKIYTPDDVPVYFKEKYDDVLSMSRGGGYWIWRPIIILDMINKTQEDDYIVYLDAGCTLNKNGKQRFYEYIEMLNNSIDNYGIMSFQMTGNNKNNGLSGKLEKENEWSCKEIFDYYNISSNSIIGNTGQYLGGILVMKNNNHLKGIINNVLKALEYDRFMFTDKYTINQHSEFKENRHEQSVFSIERKINGSVVVDGDESWVVPFGDEKSLKYPFWATRIRN